MKTKKQLVVAIASILILGSMVMSCKKKKDETPEPNPTVPNANINYALMVTGGTYPNETSYIFGQEAFPSGTISTSNAAELTGYGFLNTYGGFCYASTFGAPATMRKYAFDDNGKPQQVGAFAIPGLNTFASVYFVSQTEAYATVNGNGSIPTLVKFNPTTMLIVNSVNLSSIQKSAATGAFYQGLVHRDSLIYMGVQYLNGRNVLYDSTYVVVINRNTLQVQKLIADGRTGVVQTAGTKDNYIAPSMIIDESNDIYVMGIGNGSSVPSGVIRIKSGATNFDPSYFFNLTAASGGDCLGLLYYGNGKAFTLKSLDANNYPYDSYSGGPPSYKYHKIDITAKTSQGDLAGMPDVFSSAFVANWDPTKLYLSVPAASTNEIYSFDRTSGATAQVITSASGVINGFAKLK